MAIKSISIKEFSVFEELALKFSPGINVLIGANGTGKTHLLKLLYAMRRTLEGADIADARDRLKTQLREKLLMVFRPDTVGRLVHRRHGRKTARVSLNMDEGGVRFSLFTSDRVTVSEKMVGPLAASSIFIPSREALTIYEGFVALYTNREVSFDETYYDLCVALGTPTLRGPRGEKASKLIAPIERALDGKVVLEGDRFYVKTANGNFEAHLVSEGLRKIATIARLITNGALAAKGVLFWDEPEANLNPKLARELIEFLRTLAGAGVQIFLATHDTLVAQRLSLANEYGTKAVVPTSFIGLYRDEQGVVRADTGPVLADLQHNPMLEEFSRFSDDERKAFEESLSDGARA